MTGRPDDESDDRTHPVPAACEGRTPRNERLRILLIDSSRLFTEALRQRLLSEDDVSAVGTAGTAAEALRLLAEEQFAIAVASPTLARELWVSPLRRDYPRSTVPVIVLADTDDTPLARELFRLGALGWVNRVRSTVDLMEAIRTCRRGDVCIAPDALASLIQDQTPSDSTETARHRVLSALTHREKQVFMLLEQGMGRAEIAAMLQLSPNTVRTHIHRILRRLDVHSSLAALALARAGDIPMS